MKLRLPKQLITELIGVSLLSSVSATASAADFETATNWVPAGHIEYVASNDTTTKTTLDRTSDATHLYYLMPENNGMNFSFESITMKEEDTLVVAMNEWNHNHGGATDRWFGTVTVNELNFAGNGGNLQIDEGNGAAISSVVGTLKTVTNAGRLSLGSGITLGSSITNTGTLDISGAAFSVKSLSGFALVRDSSTVYSEGENGFATGNRLLTSGNVTSAGATVSVNGGSAVAVSTNDAGDVLFRAEDNSIYHINTTKATSSIAAAGAYQVNGQGVLTVDSADTAASFLKNTTGDGNITLLTDAWLVGGSTPETAANTQATGTLTVGNGGASRVTLRLGDNREDGGAYEAHYANVGSFSSVVLDNAQIWFRGTTVADTNAIQNLTVTGNGGEIYIHDTQSGDSPLFKLSGTTTLNGTLTMGGKWKSNVEIAEVTGADGTLKFTGGSQNRNASIKAISGTLGNLQLTGNNVTVNLDAAQGTIKNATVQNGTLNDNAAVGISQLTVSGGSVNINADSGTITSAVVSGGTVKINKTEAISALEIQGGTVELAKRGVAKNELTLNDVVMSGGNLRDTASAESVVRNIGTLTITGDAMLSQESWNAFWHIEHLNKEAEGSSAANVLTWDANTNHSTNSVLYLDGSGSFDGTLKINRESGSNLNGNYQIFGQINHEDAVKNAIVELNSNSTNRYISLALHAETVKMAGLKGTESTIVYAGEAYATQGGKGNTEPSSAAGAASTLVLNVADGKDLSFAGKVKSGISISKEGVGTQQFTGDVSAFNGSITAAGGQLVFDNHLSGTTLTLSGDGTTVKFGNTDTEGTTFSGNIITNAGSGALNVTGTSPITANNITITDGAKLNFAQKVTLTGNARPNFLYGEGGDHTGTEVNFNGGYAYTGAGNDNGYAMVIGSNVTVALGGTSNLGTKNIGMQANALLKVNDGASLTVNKIYNVNDVNSNGNISVGTNASLTTTANAGNRVKALTVGSGSTTTFGGETTIGTLNATSGGTLNFAKAGTINSATRPAEATVLTALNLNGDQKVTFQHDAAVSIGSSELANGSTLSLHYNNVNSAAVSVGTLNLAGDSATVESIWHGGVVNIQALSGEDKTLNLKNSGSSDRHTTFSLGGSATTAAQTGFSGTIALNHSDAGVDRGTVLILNDEYTTAQSVLNVTASATSNARLLAIGLNSDTVRMRGLHDDDVGALTNADNAALSHYTLFSGSGSNLANRFTGSNRATYLDNAADGTVRTLELTGSGDYETSIKVDKNINLVMSGTGTQSFSGDMSSFNGSIAATQGTLQFLKQTSSVNVADLTIMGQDATHRAEVGVYSGSTKDTSSESGISVSGTLTANQHATLNADLTMKNGSTIAVDYANGGLTMGSSVTFENGGKMNLSNDIINGLNSLTIGEGLTLFSGVDAFNINGAAYDANLTYKASDFFNLSNSDVAVTRPWDFVVKFGDDALRQGGSGQSIFLYMETPEPATATLSLLALAALAARRKRK